jgi:hypothetical protein
VPDEISILVSAIASFDGRIPAVGKRMTDEDCRKICRKAVRNVDDEEDPADYDEVSCRDDLDVCDEQGKRSEYVSYIIHAIILTEEKRRDSSERIGRRPCEYDDHGVLCQESAVAQD